MRYTGDGRRVATNVFEAALWNYSVEVGCNCGHCVRFGTYPLWWALEQTGRSDGFSDLQRRFYCSRCKIMKRKKVRPARVVASDDPPTVTFLPMPPEREWKRALSRFRC